MRLRISGGRCPANSSHTSNVTDRLLSEKHTADEGTRVSAIVECGLFLSCEAVDSIF